VRLEGFQAKWRPVRVKKTRPIKNLELRFDSIETERALGAANIVEMKIAVHAMFMASGNPSDPQGFQG
jgi:hypothetical protein